MGLFSSDSKGVYHATYIKKDGDFISLEQDASDFCEKWLRPVQNKNWDWTKRDFDKEDQKPTVAEAKVIGIMIYDDISKNQTQIDLSSLENANAIKEFFNPDSKYFDMNMTEFAYALDVELEHGKIRDANVTSNHPFLTAMVVLAHMSETLTYYKRLKVMETEGEIFEIKRKLKNKLLFTENLKTLLAKKEQELQIAKNELDQRLAMMDDFPVMDKLED